MQLIIRADSSPSMGTGHVMRCMALAQWARVLGIPCTLMGRFYVPWVEQRLAQEGIECLLILGEIPKKENPLELLQSLEVVPQNSWIVLDGYHFTLECQKAVRAAGHKLLVIDDYAHLPEYSCDILLNQNIGAESIEYKGDIGRKCLGLDYVLLRQEFVQARVQAEKRVFPETPQNILLTLGGGDFSSHLKKIAPYFSISEMTGRTLRVIAGAMQEDTIKTILKDCPVQIEILHNVRDMPSLLLDTDLCISAGGSTCWELACLGVPFLTVEVAENQRGIVSFLAQKNVAKDLLSFERQVFGQMLETVGAVQPSSQQRLKVDGEGSKNILRCMKGESCTGILSMRQVTLEDADFVLEIANDPLTRAMSFHQNQISYNEHMLWFSAQIERNTPFYIACYNSAPCAYVRFAVDNSQHVISMALHKDFRNLGLAKGILQQACEKYFTQSQAKSILAYIKKTNTASLATFLGVGFLEINSPHEETALLERQG